MRVPVSVIFAGAAGVWTMVGAAAAQSYNVSCVKGGDERTVEIISPGEVGAACDVRYAQGGVTRTPYHANNSSAFCTEKAGEIVSTLITSGFACGQVGGPLTAEARPATDSPAVDIDAAVVEALPEPAPAPQEAPTAEPVPEPIIEAAPPALDAASDLAGAPAAETAPAETSAADTPAPDSLVGAAPIEEPFSSVGAPEPAAPASSGVVEPLEPVATENLLRDDAAAAPVEASTGGVIEETGLLSEPAPATVATRGPAALAGDSLEDLQPAAEPIAAGRLVGAAPEAAPSSHAAASGAGPVQTPQPAATAPAAVSAAAPAEPKAAPKKEHAVGFREPEAVIVATLNAQAAAWNEGNLAAFMDIYWNDDNLKFVSGTSITKGWASTMKRYRERYADDSGLGQLSFEKTDVEMITDDVAVVTGRYNHVKNEEASSGAYTLVMKRIGGVWRIVHDHTVGDPPRNQ